MAREGNNKKGKALHIRGLRQRWMVNSVAPVGVLLGTVGYATGTVIAYFIGQILRLMAGQ